MKKSIRIGTGAGYSGDRIGPAMDLAKKGNLDYLVFECLAERTIALAQLQKQQYPNLGYDPLLQDRMEKCLPICVEKGVKILSNMGAANPLAAAQKTVEIARNLGLNGLKVAAVIGDDVLSIVKNGKHSFIESGKPIDSVRNNIISANAYLGIKGLLSALQSDADIILTGRVADPSLFLSPLVHGFGWSLSDYDILGKGTALGHLMECAAQVCGGYFSDGGRKKVPDLGNLGFPIAEVSEDGSFYIGKLPEAGGMVTKATCTEQLLYEVHDPSKYLTPDVVADFSQVTFNETGKDKVEVKGAKGNEPTHTYKVSVGYKEGYLAEAQISYGGQNALERGKIAIEILQERLRRRKNDYEELLFDIIGINSLFEENKGQSNPFEIRLRIVAKTNTEKAAEQLVNEVETLYTNGPAAGGGVSKSIQKIIAIQSVLLDKEQVKPKVQILKS